MLLVKAAIGIILDGTVMHRYRINQVLVQLTNMHIQ